MNKTVFLLILLPVVIGCSSSEREPRQADNAATRYVDGLIDSKQKAKEAVKKQEAATKNIELQYQEINSQLE